MSRSVTDIKYILFYIKLWCEPEYDRWPDVHWANAGRHYRKHIHNLDKALVLKMFNIKQRQTAVDTLQSSEALSFSTTWIYGHRKCRGKSWAETESASKGFWGHKKQKVRKTWRTRRTPERYWPAFTERLNIISSLFGGQDLLSYLSQGKQPHHTKGLCMCNVFYFCIFPQ